MKIKNKKYTAGDLARFYGISVDTVRLYDKKGYYALIKKIKIITACIPETI